MLTNLIHLELTSASLTGPIPDQLFAELTNLQNLTISGTGVSGSISTSLGNLSNLRRLDLSSNMLEGPIPSSIGLLTNLEFFDAHSQVCHLLKSTSLLRNSHLKMVSSLQYFFLDSEMVTDPRGRVYRVKFLYS
jgi:Leucine-rich repeat (LRR) protein